MVTLDVDLSARVLVQQGSTFPIFFARVRVCETAGGCLLEIEARDEGATGSPELVAVRETMIIESPRDYFTAFGATHASVFDGGLSADAEAGWDETVTIPEPGAAVSMLVALATLAHVGARR